MKPNLDYKFVYIYKITNSINSKEYIGQHFTNDLNDNYFGSGVAIKRAVKKHGKSNFKKEILEICIPCFNHSNLKEVFYINKFNTLTPNGYNLSIGGKSTKGFKFSDKSRLKLSDSRKKAIDNGTISFDHFCFDIFVYNLNGEFLGKYFGTNEVIKKFGLNRCSIINALNRGIQLKGYLFFREPNEFSEYSIYSRMSKNKIHIFNKDKELIEISDGMVKLAKDYNISINTISSSTRRRTLYGNSYYFIKEKDLNLFKNI